MSARKRFHTLILSIRKHRTRKQLKNWEENIEKLHHINKQKKGKGQKLNCYIRKNSISFRKIMEKNNSVTRIFHIKACTIKDN